MTTKELFEKAKTVVTYNADCNMVPVEQQKSIGFFPAGSGLWEGAGTLTEKNVLVLGQDFNNQTEHEKFINDPHKSEDPSINKTWKNLRKLLQELGIGLEQCFFSNVFMGLRKGGTKNSGPCPGLKNEDYRKSCQDFLKIQIEAVSPTLVILLGLLPMKIMRATFPDALADWNHISTMKALYDENNPKHVISTVINEKEITIAVVIHPSFNEVNRIKTFGKDKEGEVSLLKAGLGNTFKTIAF